MSLLPPLPLRRRPRGVALVLAMLYLMLMSVLAVGFYAASAMAVQIARNDRLAADAQAAAESGMQFVRYQLGNVQVDGQTSDAELLHALAKSLATQLDGTANMQGHRLDTTGGILELPSPGHFITLDAIKGTQFQAQLAASHGSVWVKVIGRTRDADISRAIQLRFDASPCAGRCRFVPVSSTYQEVSR